MTGQERTLILVRHSLPEMVTGVRASQWHLLPEPAKRSIMGACPKE